MAGGLFNVSAGDLLRVDLAGDPVGEDIKTRSAVVVESPDLGSLNLDTVVVVLMTSRLRRARQMTGVLVPAVPSRPGKRRSGSTTESKDWLLFVI